MNEFVYVVSLIDRNVIYDGSIQYAIKHMDNLDKVCDKIKQIYGIEFKQIPSCSTPDYQRFDNVDDSVDVYLTIERVDIID